MSDYVQVNPDNTGKKVETVAVIDSDDPTSTLHRQTTTLGRFKTEDKLADSLLLMIQELRALRLVLCQQSGAEFEEIPSTPLP